MFFVAGLFVVFLLELIQVALNLYAAAVTIYDNSGTSANNAFRYTQIAIVIVVIIVSLCLCCSFIACGINQLEYIKARVFEVQYMADHPEYREDSFDPLTGLPPFVMPDKESTELL
jgi:ABC-type nickel/cobalt efflux system permease component RcnA